jgi:hypothetical protein
VMARRCVETSFRPFLRVKAKARRRNKHGYAQSFREVMHN